MMTRSPQSIQDELLVLRSQGGDEEALQQLIKRYQIRLWRHARRMTGQSDAAWDVLQETLLAIARNLHRLDDPALFRTWAYRIATNKCADWTRKVQRDRKLTKSAAQNYHSLNRNSGDFVIANEPSDDAKRLHVALGDLSCNQQSILVMHYLEEMGIAEIAVALDIPAGTVKSRLFHARKQLKGLLERTES